MGLFPLISSIGVTTLQSSKVRRWAFSRTDREMFGGATPIRPAQDRKTIGIGFFSTCANWLGGLSLINIASQRQNQNQFFFCSGFEFSFCEPFLTLQGSQKRMSHLWQGGGKLLGLFIQILGYDNHPQNEQNKLRKQFCMIDQIGQYVRKSQPPVVNINIPLKEAVLFLRCCYINFGLFLLDRNLKRKKQYTPEN